MTARMWVTAKLGAASSAALQLGHEMIREAYARTNEACQRRGKHLGVGGLGADPKLAGDFVKLGGRYVPTGTDLSFLVSAASARAKQMRDA